ncbi:unnamed protein product [Amoebophrya sp. A120]|nr:unnamed protein product [Amoebophrya sp. A120]|eukprot:GSA120T00008854001.1
MPYALQQKSEQEKLALHRVEQAVIQSQKWGRGAMPLPMEHGAPMHKGKVDYEYLQCCHNGSIPGYTGYMPTKYPQSQYGQPAADVHARSGKLVQSKPSRIESEHHKPVAQKSKPADYFNVPAEWTKTYTPKDVFSTEEKPAMKKVMSNYSVSCVPGYMGYFPGKKAENIIGGGITHLGKECSKIFSTREENVRNQPEKAKPSLYKEMAEYYQRTADERMGDDLWKNPNFLRRPYCHQGYRNDSRISVTGKSFSTKYGHKTELYPFESLYVEERDH